MSATESGTAVAWAVMSSVAPALPEIVKAAGGSLDGLRQRFGLATLGEMPDDIALLVLSRNLQ